MTGNTRPMSAIEKLAAEIAIMPAPRRSKGSVAAYVSWELIERLRAEFDRHGYDWKGAHKEYRRIVRERAAERERERNERSVA